MKYWICIGSILMALAVGAGAFGAHGLRNWLDSYSLAVYEKAVFYHFVHALGILIVSSLAAQSIIPGPHALKINCLLFFGTVVFSGSLYALAITGVKWLGAITPLGGTAFILAWILLSYISLKS